MISEERLQYLESIANQDKDIGNLCAEVRRLQAHVAEVRSRYLESQRALIEKTSEVERLSKMAEEDKLPERKVHYGFPHVFDSTPTTGLLRLTPRQTERLSALGMNEAAVNAFLDFWETLVREKAQNDLRRV